MTDIEKVIKGLEGIYRCVSPVSHTCGDCPYQDNHVECIRRVVSDAIALLKEQEPVEPIKLENWWKCPSCSGNIVYNMKYCPGCGRKVKWE